MTEHATLAPSQLLQQAHSRLGDLRNRMRGALEQAGNIVLKREGVTLDHAMDAERKEMRTHHGQTLSYYQDKKCHGRPLVLIHSINACASAYEMKPLFERFRTERPVYAVDLSGFGFSERDRRPYTPDLYVDELIDFLTRVKDGHDAPDVVALSLSGEFLALVAARRADLVHSLAIISPTGLEAKAGGRRIPSAGHADAREPWWAPFAFSVIASRPSIRYFLHKAFDGNVDKGLAAYDFNTAHQPGAWHAPVAFLRGGLFTRDIYETYARTTRPVLALYDKDGYVRFNRIDELVTQSSFWQKKRIPGTRGMPQFEKLDETVSALEAFWREHHRPHA